ncbi:MAG: transketolase family protein, partial [Flavobacteriales bacterium]
HHGTVYLRFGRPKVPTFTSRDQVFKIGKAWHIHAGSDVTIIATGHLVWKSVLAAQALAKEGISVDLINIHTIKPLDEQAILDSARKTGTVVTAEEHQIIGGLGSMVASCLAQHHPTPLTMVGVQDSFGESGTPDELMKKYGLEVEDVVKAAQAAVLKKK